MFPLTREVLMYVLIGLSSVLLVLVVLILRKRGMLGGKRWDEAPKPTPDETGPTDHGAIKEKLKSDKGADVPRPPEPAPPAPVSAKPSDGYGEEDEDVPMPKEPARKMKLPFGQKDDGENPFPIEPGDEDGLEKDEPQEGAAEEGEEIGDEDAQKPPRKDSAIKEQKDQRVPVAPPYPRGQKDKGDDSIGFVDLGDGDEEKQDKPGRKEDERAGLMRRFARAVTVPGGSQEKPPKPRAPAEQKEERYARDVPVPGREEAPPAPKREQAPSPKGEALSTADIMKSPQGFKGHTVSLEGEMKLSSRGAEDAWYILFDGRGSVVVRSKQQIDSRRARILAKVEQTRLGQIYLDVISYEKA